MHAPYALQQRVVHPELGSGVVSDLEPDRLTVLPDEIGCRTLALAVVEQERLLAPDDGADVRRPRVRRLTGGRGRSPRRAG